MAPVQMRRGACRLPGSRYFGRKVVNGRREIGGNHRVQPDQMERSSSEGLEKGEALRIKVAATSTGVLRHGNGALGSGQKARGVEDVARPRHIPSSWRVGRDIVIPVRGAGKQYQFYAVIVRNSLDGHADKVGVCDNTVLLDSPGRQFIGALLHQRVKQRKSMEDLVFPFTSAKYRDAFTQSGAALGIPGLHPYQTRHGGAAEDLNGGERDHAQVKARGRWMTDTSVRRYTKTGKIQQMMSKLSAAHLEFCRWLLLNMDKVMQGLVSPRMP